MKLPTTSVSKPLKRGQQVLNLRTGRTYTCVSSSSLPCLECAGTGKRWTVKLKNTDIEGVFKTSLKHLASAGYELLAKVVEPKESGRVHVKHGRNREAKVKAQRSKAEASEAKDATTPGAEPTVRKTSKRGQGPTEPQDFGA